MQEAAHSYSTVSYMPYYLNSKDENLSAKMLQVESRHMLDLKG